MYIREGIVEKEIKRRGELKTVRVPIKRVCLEGEKKLRGVGLSINVKERTMSFCKGKHAIIISDLVGVREPVEGTVFLAGDEMIIDIQKGILYVREGEKVYGISKSLDITEAAKEGIKWVTKKDLESTLKCMVSASFHLKCRQSVEEYTSNLMFTIHMEHKRVHNKKEETDADYLYSMRIKEYISDIGLEQFDFKIEEDEREVIAQEEIRLKAEKEAEREIKEQEKQERERREVDARERELELRYAAITQGDDYTEGVVTVEDINTALDLIE